MVPPKYKFYVFKGLSGNINRGYVVNDTTGAVSSGYDTAHSVTQLLSVAGYDNVRILTTLYNSCYLCEYDKDNAFIGKKSLPKSTDSLTLNSNTAFIRLQFYILNEGLTDSNNIVIGGSLVNPHYKELNKKYAKESGQEFFRITLDGKITLFGDDYELINNASIEDNLLFVIDKFNRTTNKWIEYYKGEFNKTDCKLDYEKKSCELKMSPIDQYTHIINKYDNTYDLIKLTPAISKINLHKRSLMQVYVRGANSISNFFGGTYWEDDINEVIDSHADLIEKYYFSYIKAGNEFYVEGAGIEAANGVYAGTNGNWSRWNGHTAKLTKVISQGTAAPATMPTVYAIQSTDTRTAAYDEPTNTYAEDLYKLQIVQNSDDSVLYQSEWTFYLSSADVDADNIYIARDDIKMINTSNSSDYFVLSNTFVYHIYRRLLCDVDVLVDAEGTKNTYDLPTDDFVTDNRNYKKCIGLRGGLFFCTSKTTTTPTKYGLNDYGEYFTDEFIPSSSGLGRALPISRNFWANASLWFVYDSFYNYWEETSRKVYILKDSYSIGAVIKALLKQIDPTIKHEETSEYSRFLYDTSVPISMARFYVYLTPKSNILKGDYDQAAQKAEITFEDLMNMLRDCFRCYWFIEDGKFKIEHISYFMNGQNYTTQTNYSLDFTKLKDQFNKKSISYFQSAIEFDKSELNSRYEFNWMDDATEIFGGTTIDVISNYVQKDKTEEINASQFSSDIDFMLFNPSKFSEDGFALLCPIKRLSGNIMFEYGGVNATTGALPENIIRMRSKPIYFKAHSYGRVILNYKVPSTLIVAIASNEIAAYAYKGTAPIKKIPNLSIGNGLISFTADGTFDNIRVSFKHADDSNISLQEVNTSFVYALPELPISTVSLQDENKNPYEALAQNWYASWNYLVNFYLYDLPAFNAECNTLGQLNVYNIKKSMRHAVEFHAEDDPNELQLIKTTIGNGKIDSISINLDTRLAKANLMYMPK